MLGNMSPLASLVFIHFVILPPPPPPPPPCYMPVRVSEPFKKHLCSAAAEAEIRGGTHDTCIGASGLTAAVLCTVARVVVERSHYLSILIGLAFSSVERNLSVAVGIRGLGTNRRAGSLVGGVSDHHFVFTATASSCGGASPAGGCSCHVKRLPRQVEGRILIITSWEEILRQMTALVELCKTTGLTRSGQLGFNFSNLKM